MQKNNITPIWYQNSALKTMKSFKSKENLKLNAHTGVIGEYGELFDYIKKLYTHDLTQEKKEEILNLAPYEIKDMIWYLSTCFACLYDYTLDDTYNYIFDNFPVINNQENTSSIDKIYSYLEIDSIENEDKDIFSIFMRFKKVLNRLDDDELDDEIIDIVANVLLQCAYVSKVVFSKELSEILINNITKLSKRYQRGFDSLVANRRIDANKKYKEEEDFKVYSLKK